MTTRDAKHAHIKNVLRDPCNERIPRCPRAGQVTGPYQVAHNGLKILTGKRCNHPLQPIISANRGIHEPRMAYAFQEVLKLVPSGGVIIELGACLAFYSLWFCKEIENGRAILVEPIKNYQEYGRAAFAANGMHGVSIVSGEIGDKKLSVDDIINSYGLDHLNILHADIMGREQTILRGASKSLGEKKVSFLLIAIHSKASFKPCLSYLRDKGYMISMAKAPDGQEGLIVARSPDTPALLLPD